MKRKAEELGSAAANGHGKRQAVGTTSTADRFGPGIFDSKTVQDYTRSYADSAPYKHAVVSGLIDDNLLRSVRTEVLDNIHFTPKETDIYKIHQSGDLANLDGLPASALEKLPSLLKLRDALYSQEFRAWVSTVSGAGSLSGKKTDMAVNVYVPGCHLLCHDDVIGSRRVSYILYLTNPDIPWQANWGGALRLYPTEEKQDDDGKTYKVPQAEWSKVIPPAWNQLSFFTVQPGESFHDVEEVYKRASGESEDDGGRFRMAISGWFHIPQEGEEGYEPGLEEKMAERSSLQQLQGKALQFDEPQTQWLDASEAEPAEDVEASDGLTEPELDFLLQYMTPNYLTPDTIEELGELFADESTLQLSNFFNKKFSAKLRNWLESEQSNKIKLKTSTPPYKHRYQYLQPVSNGSKSSPYEAIINDLLSSLAFRKWMSLATGLTLTRCSTLARRFRRSLDYQLAQSYDGDSLQLEYTLDITPTTGWTADDAEDSAQEPTKSDGQASNADEEEDNVGGYELYMAGDEHADDDDNESGSDDGVTIPTSLQHQQPQSSTGAGTRRSATKQRKKADPAVYQAASAEGDDDDVGILFSNPATWNTLSIVLRDKGTLKFVKYVSRAAKGDRWDFSGCFEVVDDGEENGEDGEEESSSDGDEDVPAEEESDDE